jgi:amidase
VEHRFQPSVYHRTFGPHEPALRVAPGDRIVTSTIDAAGHDAEGRQVCEGPNPQTGPFYIEGAEPGDALVVRLERIEPSRGSGFTSTTLAAGVVDPWFVRRLPERSRDRWRLDWAIDRERRVAGLETGDAALPAIEVPLWPMLGCIGVAPAGGQAISTATSGAWGGNMDYRGVVAGATLTFPVFVEGALLRFGDGHAVQGDGEVVGSGVDTSMEVELTVDLVKEKRVGWPRGETAEDIFTFGNARPLEQALQHATTEMLRWLEADYGLSATTAGHLLGQCVEYDVGNVFDPAYTMVCRLAKRWLPAPTG